MKNLIDHSDIILDEVIESFIHTRGHMCLIVGTIYEVGQIYRQTPDRKLNITIQKRVITDTL